MKKVLLSAAIVLGGLSSFTASAFTMNNLDEVVIVNQQEFKEINVNDLPQAVKDALAADFENATLDKAYVNDQEQYKLDISVEGMSSTVYADKDGNWIEM